MITWGAGPGGHQMDVVFSVSDFSSSVHILHACLKKALLMHSLSEDMCNRCISGLLG